MYHIMICDDDRIFVDYITHMILACGLDKSNVSLQLHLLR